MIQANSSLSRWVSRTRNTHLAHEYPYLAHDYSHLVHDYPHLAHDFRVGRDGVFCCKWSKIDWMSMNEETARTGIRVREAEKAHGIRTFSQGRGAKKKDPNCIQIRVLLWYH